MPLIPLLLGLACSDYKISDLPEETDTGAPDLVVEPGALDLGTVDLGCEVEGWLTMRNAGTALLIIDELSWGGSSAMLGTSPDEDLLPGASAPVLVLYGPDAVGSHGAEMTVRSNDPDQPVLVVPVTGAAVAPEVTDHFVQPSAAIDVLWVVDNSGSMAEEQARVIADVSAFFSYFVSLGLDFHVGVVTTDVVTATMAGRLQGSPAVITPDLADPELELAEALAVGTEDLGDESGLLAMQLALSEPLLSTENAGFLRDEARLLVVFLSDEPEQSGVAAKSYSAFLSELKVDPSWVQVAAIVGDAGTGCSTTCEDLPSTAQPGDAYIEVATDYGGVVGSICACDLEATLDGIGLASTLFVRQYPLSGTPVDPAGIRVVLDGLPLESGWAYDADHNAVILDAPPIAGSTLSITWPAPPGC